MVFYRSSRKVRQPSRFPVISEWVLMTSPSTGLAVRIAHPLGQKQTRQGALYCGKGGLLGRGGSALEAKVLGGLSGASVFAEGKQLLFSLIS